MFFPASRRERLISAALAEPSASDLRAGILAPVSCLGVGSLLFVTHDAENKKASPEGPASWRARLDRQSGTRDRGRKVRLAQGRGLPRAAWALYPLGGYEFLVMRRTARSGPARLLCRARRPNRRPAAGLRSAQIRWSRARWLGSALPEPGAFRSPIGSEARGKTQAAPQGAKLARSMMCKRAVSWRID